jgi:hypothetical protein
MGIYLGSTAILSGGLGDTDSCIVAQSGDNLASKYAQAKSLTPGGSALSQANRATLLILPGTYTFTPGAGNAGLLLDADFVDLVGAGTSPAAVVIASNGRTVVQTANDVLISGLSLKSTALLDGASDADGDAAYFPSSNLPATRLLNVYATSHRVDVVYSGHYEGCVAGDYAFGSGLEGTAEFSGVAVRCQAGDFSFGTMLFSGTAHYCTAGEHSFGGSFSGGAGEFSGYAEGCVAGDYSFGSDTGVFSGEAVNCLAGNVSFTATGTFSGKATNCKAGDGSFASGEDAVFSGIAINCVAGAVSFAGGDSEAATLSGRVINCLAGSNSFGGNTGTVSGEVIGCVSTGDESFGGSITGKVLFCVALDGDSFGTRSGSGVAKRCFNAATEVSD